jgi:hypothetical protein
MLRKREDEFSVPAGSGKAIEALADRVELLAGMVRDAVGGVAATKGDIAALDRRISERLQSDSERAATALDTLRQELQTLRLRMPEPGAVAVASTTTGEEVTRTVTALTDRVDSLAGMVRTAAGRMTATEGAVAAIRDAIDKGGGPVMDALADIRTRLDSVSAVAERAAEQVSRVAFDSDLPKRLEGKLEALADRVDTLSGAVGDTAGRFVQGKADVERVSGRVSALEQQVEERTAGVSRTIDGLRQDIVQLSAQLGDDPSGQERVDDLADAVAAMRDRLDTVSGAVRASLGRNAGAGGAETGAFTAGLDELEQKVGGLAVELRAEIAALTESRQESTVEPERFAAIEDHVQELGRHLTRLEAAAAIAEAAAEKIGVELRSEFADGFQSVRAEVEELGAQIVRLEGAAATADGAAERLGTQLTDTVCALAERLEQIEHDRLVVAANAEATERQWVEERQALEARLDVIASAAVSGQTSLGPDVHRLLNELGVRLERMEHQRAAAADLAALTDTWRGELESLESRLSEELASVVARTEDEPGGPVLEGALEDLAARIDRMESDRDAVASELFRTAEAWKAERAALHERVAELAARIVTGPATSFADPVEGEPLAERELDQLRIGIEGLRMRLAYHEKTVAEVAGRGVVERLEELSARLDRLQSMVTAGAAAGPSFATHMSGGTSPEVSVLLHRMERAEQGVRDTHDSFLEHMERMASRLDFRLHQLEAADV